MIRPFLSFYSASNDYCPGYTWIRIPISPLFGTFLADICMIFVRVLVDFRRRISSRNLPFVIFSDFLFWFLAKFWIFFCFSSKFRGFFLQEKIKERIFARLLDLIRMYPDYLADILTCFSEDWRGKKTNSWWKLAEKVPKKAEKWRNRRKIGIRIHV